MNWYALKTASQKEFDAAYQMHRLGLVTYIPVENRYRRANRYAKRKTRKNYRLIPGYCFVASPDDRIDWYRALNIDEVFDVLRVAGRPDPLPPDAIRTMQLMAQLSISFQEAPDGRRCFVVGDNVEITHGLLKGRVARVHRIINRRARLLLDWFNSTREVDIRLDYLDAA